MNGCSRIMIYLVLATSSVSVRLARTQEPAPHHFENSPETSPILLGDSGPSDNLAPASPAQGSDQNAPARPSSFSSGKEKGLGMGGGPMGGGAPGYEVTWYPSRGVSGQASDFGVVRQRIALGAPLWRNETDMVLAHFSLRNTLFATDAILPDSLRPFPEQLWNVNFGLNYMHQFDNGWMGGMMGGIGSASDTPFQSINDITANLGVFVRVPVRNGRDAWQFMLSYMVGGPIDFPIPMVAYAWNPSDRLKVNLGLPFTVAWQPAEDWMLNFTYFPLNNVNARLTYDVTERIQVFAAYEYLNESYFLTDRTNIEERFFAFEQRLSAGVQWAIWEHATVDWNAGYSLGRNFGEGENQWESLSDRVDVAPGPFFGLNFRLRF